jgi:phytanoyl-CoA hydroxylase
MSLKNEFEKNGVCVIENFFDESLIAACLEDLLKFDGSNAIRNGDLVEDELNEEKHLKYFQYVNSYIRSFDKLNSNRLLNIASELLEQDVYFTSMGVHNKAPKIGTITPPHQDNFYSCRTPPDFVTAYIPLLHMSESNGGIQYALASHQRDILPHMSSPVPGFSSGISEEYVKEYEIFKPELNVGDVVFHHGNLIHFANKNKTDLHRYAVAVGIFGEKASEDKEMRVKYLENLKINKGNA